MNTHHSTVNRLNVFSFAFLLLLASNFSFASDDKGIDFFSGTLAEAQALAKKEQKPIFAQLTASWCLPCRQMDKNVFPLSSVGGFFNSNFISLKIDAESFDGIELKQNYNIMTVPESFFFDSNGRLMLHEGGFKGEQDMLSLGSKILKQHPKPHKTKKPKFIDKTKKQKKQKTKKTKAKRTKTSKSTDLYDQKSGFELFWLRLTGSIKKPHNMEWVYHNAQNFDTQAMDILLRQKNHYANHYGEAAINKHIKSILYSKLAVATGDKNEYLYNAIVKYAKKAKMPESNHFVVELQSRYFEGIGDDANFVKVNRQFMRSYKGNDPAIYHKKAWEVADHSENKADLLKAISWLEKSVEISPQFYNLKSLAEFYHKAGKKRKARRTAKWAIEYGKNEGRNYNTLLEIAE